MPARQTGRAGRQQYNGTRGQMYVYGNVAAKPAYDPRKDPRRREREEAPKKKPKASRQVRKNRRQALRMNPGYVLFLTAAAMIALVVCVYYVKLQSRITNRSENITALQEELADMREENNTHYNAVMDSVNLEEVRERAQDVLGMVYASPEQIIEYTSPSSDYVKQYESIPEDGVIAESAKHAD